MVQYVQHIITDKANLDVIVDGVHYLEQLRRSEQMKHLRNVVHWRV